MKCPNCGYEFEEGIFCPECGTKNDPIDGSVELNENPINNEGGESQNGKNLDAEIELANKRVEILRLELEAKRLQAEEDEKRLAEKRRIEETEQQRINEENARKAEEERKRQEAEAARKAEKERKRQEAEAARKARAEKQKQQMEVVASAGKKTAGTMKNLILWIVCGFFMLGSIEFLVAPGNKVSLDYISSVLCLLYGLMACPPIGRMLTEKGIGFKKKTVIVVVSVFVAVAASMI